jgi:hypothetical protein
VEQELRVERKDKEEEDFLRAPSTSRRTIADREVMGVNSPLTKSLRAESLDPSEHR